MLLKTVLEAHGGSDQWSRKRYFSAHVSVSGALLPPPDGRPPLGTPYVEIGGYKLPTAPRAKPTLRELVIEGETATPYVRIHGSADLTRCTVYDPACIEIRDMSDRVLDRLDAPGEAFASRDRGLPLTAIERMLLFSVILWEAIAGPFAFDLPGAAVEENQEMPPAGLARHWLAAKVSASLDPLVPTRLLGVDSQGFVRESRYALPALHPTPIADTHSAHMSFDGILLPTLRRWQAINPDGSIAPTPLIDIEIFDVRFS